MPLRPGERTPAQVEVVAQGVAHPRADLVVTEEPIEFRLASDAGKRTVAVTMRTPGADVELATGFLFAEGIVAAAEDIAAVDYCAGSSLDPAVEDNVLNVVLRPGLAVEEWRLERHFFTSSACGVCGKAGIEQLALRGHRPAGPGPRLDAATIYGLPQTLRAAQGVFADTGGLHAAGLFSADGTLLALREDVGRHNALDKLIGWALREGRLPLADQVVMVSGRSSFEIVQKALAAGAPVVCAVSAPSSLAIAVAQAFDITLVGFMRGDRFNVYSGAGRVVAARTGTPAPAGP